MSLTSDDRETVRLIAKEIAREFADEMQRSQREAMTEAITHHQQVCPLQHQIYGDKRMIAGALAVLTLLVGAATTVASLIVHWFTKG